jgi:hypothetical protein
VLLLICLKPVTSGCKFNVSTLNLNVKVCHAVVKQIIVYFYRQTFVHGCNSANNRTIIQQHFGRQYKELTKLPQSGSDRIYFRINDLDMTYIATFGLNIKENKTFVNFSRHFQKAKFAGSRNLCGK